MRSGLLALVVLTVCAACSSSDPAPPAPESAPSSTVTPSEPPAQTPEPTPDPASVLGVAAQDHRGEDLRIAGVRERTATYTSYDVTWRLRSSGPGASDEPLRLSGVLNVPSGDAPFPAVVLAHGYIDPAAYASGQGMTRERGFLAERGYVALHVDYRGHAGSDPDPSGGADVRLGYAVDVLSAVDALRRTDLPEVLVDGERIALFGRSMGGGVVQKAAAIAPGTVSAVVAWASVSSLEGENFEHFIGADDPRAAPLVAERGLPTDSPDFWRGVSPRPHFDRITEPVLAVHGRYDDTCPPRWARATQRAMRAAGVDSELAWYDDGHAFGPAFFPAMERTVDFLAAELG